MILTADQKDAVTELVNIAFSRTAAALSELTGNRVELAVPEVSAHPIAQLMPALGRFVRGEVATVHQIFGGPVSGDAFLLLDVDGATRLVDLLTGAGAPTRQMGASAKEVLAEVGNILLNACLGTFGNLLKVQVSFSVPHLSIEHVGAILESLKVAHEEIRYALVVHAGFRLRDTQVTGYMVIVLSVASLDRLIHAVEDWEQSQS